MFVPRLPAEYAIWEGKLHTLEDFQKRYAVHETYYTDEIAQILKKKEAAVLLTLVTSLSEIICLIFSCRNIPSNLFSLHHLLIYRVVKTATVACKRKRQLSTVLVSKY